ncbi:PREDICTED: peptidyl-prolyl cis-trans isomerase Pin1-like isoform X3 [Ipomoea nil]|uniref:peptidyl-prolyl cis-trans isomerase Pin1-like isoform X3 n=1 Tax=Ipomoea nil TaxID=35883 RepID=UPI000900DF58|nr:PREDICTED: peptidyl-prolyl cis-trans isomerase Pin1-like isoform X3 [Ipomoea nil]XP_019182939.1 PREDICTED: peptidyl-prolyl cis-trans isomerase Pin1-like isoform X3 [Ipomoea nil]
MKTDSDRKRKNDSVTSTDRAEKVKRKTEMSSSSGSGDKVRASHVLIKHQGSRRKASWKDPEGHAICKRTREDAVAQLKSLREDLVSGKADFKDIASRYSDCSSAKRGGDLDKFMIVELDLCCCFLYIS